MNHDPQDATVSGAGAGRLPAGLYLVGTPIGNLEDITLRALRILGEADVILAEDTRISRRLLDRHGIHRPLISCHRHNEAGRAEQVMRRIRQGEAVALISDSGMPGISDPGSRVAQACRRDGSPVTVVPGPSAVTSALALSGLGGGSFCFAGFLPHKSGARLRRLRELCARPEPVVLFESPFRFVKLLGEIESVMPRRRVFVARELTKVFEECREGTAAELRQAWTGRAVRGEFVVILSPAGDSGGASEPEQARGEVEGETGGDPGEVDAHVAD